MINRRNFLRNASLFTLGGLMAGKVGNAVAAQPATAAVFEATAAKNIGLQIYSLGDELYKDVPGGMKKLKKMGYQTIELAGYGKRVQAGDGDRTQLDVHPYQRGLGP